MLTTRDRQCHTITSPNYSHGWVVEPVKVGEEPCNSWLLLRGGNLWSEGIHAFRYSIGMMYLYMEIALAYDNCMCAAAVITREKCAVCHKEMQEHAEEGSFIWNETVANLILMTLGSSVPGILLAILETIVHIDNPASNHSTFTVIGSAVPGASHMGGVWERQVRTVQSVLNSIISL